MSDGSNQEITRRDFLKILGIGTTAAATAAVISACEKVTSENTPSHVELATGDKASLSISGQEGKKEITFRYSDQFLPDKLQTYKNGEEFVAKPFQNGAETTRWLGEITELKISHIEGINPDLADVVKDVGIYPLTTGPKNNGTGRKGLSEFADLYAIPVIVSGPATEYYGIDNPPLEKNIHYKDDIKEFGLGLAVGVLDSTNQFFMQGYICDARAVALS